MTRVPVDSLFLRQAVERGLLALEQGRAVVDRARRVAATGQPVDVLALTIEGLPADDAAVLRWLYEELAATAVRREAAPPSAPPVEATPVDAGRTLTPQYTQAAPRDQPMQIGNYQVLACLGAGASGTVYRARHRIMQNEVAIKLQHEGADELQTERFFREARAATVLRHPNLVSVLDLGLHDDDTPYLVMELADGEPLQALIRREGRLDALRAASYAEQLARGLAEAHRTLLHRDVKPENILICGELARLTDFGLVRKIRAPDRLTSPGDLLGSPAYMSPEQARGEVDLDARCDVYGLGATLYEMLTGRAPFTGTNLNEVLLAVIDDEPAPPSGVDPVLELICLRCLAKDREKRFPSAGALADELARFRAFRASSR